MYTLYTWMVFVHLVGVFGFLLAHGVSAAVAWRLRAEREPAALRTVLALSASTRTLMYASLALLLVGGIAAGAIGRWWGRAWLWAAVALLILVTLAALFLALTYFRRLRQCLAASESASDAPEARRSLEAVLASPAPLMLSLVGLAGLLAILWLMVFKPG
jgi:uncharacterized membrane protein